MGRSGDLKATPLSYFDEIWTSTVIGKKNGELGVSYRNPPNLTPILDLAELSTGPGASLLSKAPRCQAVTSNVEAKPQNMEHWIFIFRKIMNQVGDGCKFSLI